MVVELRCEAVRWVDDEPFPGIVEVQFTDAGGRRWSLIDKTPIFGGGMDLDSDSVYPVEVTVDCVVRECSGPPDNDGIVTVSTSPHGVATPDGCEEFTVRRDQIIR
ncbi:hypothetical protein [Kitasatospora xanthocidica]|uniref:hypothetical protein n=1 Tax=Kitasatospora xanthocidica TaxID=83382 RepID=UPI001E42696C|nr:hypothetical protein [Kitasatospora xanthocidica]